MLFAKLSEYFLKIEQTASRLEMTRVLAQLFSEAAASEIDQICYLLQGRVSPQYEKLDFVLAERSVFKAMVLAFSLAEKSAKLRFQKLGDLGKTAQEFRQEANSLFSTEKNLSVNEVFIALKKICQFGGTGSVDSKLNEVSRLLQELDPLSSRYLIRIISNKLRLGFSDMTVLDALSWFLTGDKSVRGQIEPAYNVRPDLGLIAKIIKTDGLSGVKKITPKVGVPIIMARAERVGNPEEILEKIGRCAIEPKYDGFRLQFHLDVKNGVKVFSRSFEEMTYMFPDLVSALTKEVKASTVIFEGEAVGFDEQKNSYLPFQETVQRKRKYDILVKAAEIPLRVFVFDILFLNGQSLINQPYEVRKKTLRTVFPERKNVLFQVTKEKIVSQAQEISLLFQDEVHNGLEGIMAKKLTGNYQAGARGWNWIKFKHSYDKGLIDTLDCVVMGYDYGQGKRTNFGIGAFLVGVYDRKKNQYVTLAKVGTGLTDVEWQKMANLCSQHQVKEKPNQYFVNKQLTVDVWVEPEIVVEIRADEITRSPMHTAGIDEKGSGLALRFPRLECFREDKKVSEITTISEVVDIFQKQKSVTIKNI